MHNPMAGRITDTYNLRRKHPVFQTVQPHRGIDLGAPIGTKPWDYIGADVRAAYGGVVEEVCANWQSGWGAIWGRSGDGVFVRNPDGEAQYYGHLSRVDVRKGQRVTEGQVIGGMGVSGNVTGPHLHFEIHNTGSGRSNNWTWTRDPMADFRAAGITPGVDNAITITPAASTPKEGTLSKAEVQELKDYFITQLRIELNAAEARIKAEIGTNEAEIGAANRRLDSVAKEFRGRSAGLDEKVTQLADGVEVTLDEARVAEVVREASKEGAAEAFVDGVNVDVTATVQKGK